MAGADTSFDLLVWRSALADAPRVPTGVDLAEWAETLTAAGADEAAALLGDVVAICRGFPGRSLPEASSGPGRKPEWTLDHAVQELRMLARDMAPLDRPRLISPPTPGYSGRPDNPAGIGGREPLCPARDDITGLARRLRVALEAAPGPDAADTIDAVCTALAETGRCLPTHDYRSYSKGPLPLLAVAIAASALIAWSSATRDLACAPQGSALLLHRAAQLSDTGIGPYFRNVGRLVRDAADVFDLAGIAAEAGGGRNNRDRVGAWVALLSRGCDGPLLQEIVDELGDRDAGAVLGSILDRTMAQPAATVDYDLIFRIRDAALDNAAYDLAARAQRTVARLRPDSKLEGVILAAIEASGGEYGRAEAEYSYWWARSPGDVDLAARLYAVRAFCFDEFRITQGFGSPADRRDTRLRRRGILPDYPRRRGERIEAVDVR